jgi:spore coat polysaccharide biosynthesis protein SpsF (cytidylyltransferase family)
MKVVAVIQARMSSTRLPGKVLMPLAEQPVLWHVVDRLRHCKTLHGIVVATSTDSTDDAIADWCTAQQVDYYRGSLNDVLDRYYCCAMQYGADVIVRITADCPVIDPTIVDEVVANFIEGGFQFYGLKGEFPDGLDCTVFSFGAIERAWKEAKLPSEREHVGPYIENHPEWFKSGGLEKFTGLSHYRWTLDEPRDYAFLQRVFAALDNKGPPFLAQDILALLERIPELADINGDIVRNAGYLKSLAAERNLHV